MPWNANAMEQLYVLFACIQLKVEWKSPIKFSNSCAFNDAQCEIQAIVKPAIVKCT